jgi:apolipoprotein N-acyltransferase
VNALRPWARLALSVVSGLVLALCYPNSSWAPLLPFALVPLMAALEGATGRIATLCGLVFGVSFWLVTVSWIAFTIQRFGELPWVLAWLALLMTALIMCVPMGLFAAAVAAVEPRSTAGFLATWTAAWVAQEGFRTYVYIFGGFPWALIAYPLAETPVWIQTAALGGVWLTCALVVLTNALVYRVVCSRTSRGRIVTALGAVVLVWGVHAWGRHELSRMHSQPPRPAWASIAVVQTNVNQELRFQPDERRRIYEDLVAQTREVAREMTSSAERRLVLWPESASPYQWSWSEEYRADVVRLCRELDVAILLSTAWTDDPTNDEAPYYNAALLVTKTGPVLPPYFKVRLVPFGEYVPVSWILSRFKTISRAVPAGFTPGADAVPIPFGDQRLGGAVCYEVVYPWIVRREVRKGASLLFTLTNDSWYGTAGARRQHFQAVIFRAVETRRMLVRAAVTGISGSVVPTGEATQVPPDVKRSFVVHPTLPVEEAPAVGIGDGFLHVCAAGVLVGILRRRVFLARRGAERRGEEQPR